MRHDTAAGRKGIVHLHKTVLIGIPDDQFLGKTGKMHHKDRKVRQKLQQIIAVGHTVHGIAGCAVKSKFVSHKGAVQGIGRSRHGTGSQRALVHAHAAVFKPGAVPAKHFKIGTQMMRQCCGLCFLQMGKAGHIGVCIGLHQIKDDLKQFQGFPADLIYSRPCVQSHVQGHLIVAAAACVQTLSRISDSVDQIGFHEAVDILIFRSDLHFSALKIRENTLQAFFYRLTVLCCQDALFSQHPGVYQASLDILPVKALVESNRIIESFYRFVCLFCESAAP